MLNFLARLWARLTQPKAGPDVFKPRARQLYHYWNGQKMVHADPMVLWKRLASVMLELQADLMLADSPSKSALKGQEESIKKIRMIFDLEPFEEGGLEEVYVRLLLDHFWAFCEGVKKNSSPTPTSVKETPPTTEPTSDAPLPTSSGSDSGSTADVPSTEPPTPSPSVQGSESAAASPEGTTGVQ